MATQYKLVKRSFFSRVFNDFHRTHDKVVDEAATFRDDIREAREKHYKSWRPCPVPAKRVRSAEGERINEERRTRRESESKASGRDAPIVHYVR